MRKSLDWASMASGLLRFCERQMRQCVTVLMYHRVLPLENCRDYPLQSLVIPDEAFDQQIRWLSERFDVLTVRDAIHEVKRRRAGQRPIVSVTFDDGYDDNYSIAATILNSHAVQGTFFVTSGFVANGTPLWFDRAAACWSGLPDARQRKLLGELAQTTRIPPPAGSNGSDIGYWMELLKRSDEETRGKLIARAEELTEGNLDPSMYRPMTIDELRDLASRGHEIASHTVSHPILTQLSDGELCVELENARAALQKWTGDEIVGFCYPNGDYDPRVQAAVNRAGYGYACTTQTGQNPANPDVYGLKRVAVTQQRVLNSRHEHDALGFRSEVCRLREWWR